MKRLALIVCLLCLVGVSFAQVSYISSFAGARQKVYVTYCGLDSKVFAGRFRNAILDDPLYKGGNERIPLVSVQELAEARDLKTASVLLFAEGPEVRSIPASLGALLPFKEEDLSGRQIAARTRAEGSQMVLTFVAPDDETLRRVTELLNQPTYQQLNSSYHMNRLTIFASPSLRKSTQGWGKSPNPNAFDDIVVAGLGESLPVAGRDRLYLVSRGDDLRSLPQEARELLGKHTPEPTEMLATKSTTSEGDQIVLITAPTARLAAVTASWFPNVESVPSPAFVKQALDLRQLHEAVVLVGAADSSVKSAQLGWDIALSLESQLPFKILRAVAVDPSLQANIPFEALAEMPALSKIRYVLHVGVEQVSGGTSYRSEVRPLVSIVPFSESPPDEPDRPNRGNYKDEIAYEKAVAKWRDKHDKWSRDYEDWKRRKNYHECEEPVSWEFTIDRVMQANVKATIRLVEMTDQGPRVVWKYEANKADSSSVRETTQQITVHGYNNQPTASAAPAGNYEISPDLLKEILLGVTRDGLGGLLNQAWFSGQR